jgi:outer membrane protein insertion porin family
MAAVSLHRYGGLFNNSLRSRYPAQLDPVPSGDGQRLALNVQANGVQYQAYCCHSRSPGWWLTSELFSFSLNHSIQWWYQLDVLAKASS